MMLGVKLLLLPPWNTGCLTLRSHTTSPFCLGLNGTIDEVCEALMEGNWDMLGTELLESLLKMAPTKEVCKLKDFKDESAFKLGPAEKFLKIVLDIPFASKRVDTMLYISNFDSESEYSGSPLRLWRWLVRN